MQKFVIIPKGRTVYVGSRESTQKTPKYYAYKGQEGTGSIMYTTTNPDAAIGYSNCLSKSNGWVRTYTTRRTLAMPNVTKRQLHYDWNETDKKFCQKGLPGYYLRWAPHDTEIVFCNPKKQLKLKNLKKCSGPRLFKSVKVRKH